MTPVLQVPARVRAWLYGAFSVVSLAVGAAQVGYAAVPADSPTWLNVALAVVPFVGAGLTGVAATHTPTAAAEPERQGRHELPGA